MFKNKSKTLLNPTNSGFGFKDYINMAKFNFKAPFIYFFERHIFDLINKTDTHKRLLVEDYQDNIIDLEHSFNHACSWTSIIRFSLEYVCKFLSQESNEYSFFDIGCGKGKVLLVASKNKYDENLKDMYGVEINKSLVEIALENFKKMKLKPCQILTESAATIDLGQINKKMILYLYNPFDEYLLKIFLNNQTFSDCIIIYNNPVYDRAIKDSGFMEIFKKDHKMTNGRISIYKNV
tara:strand:- start:9781 stop:10488 length:708 start_codon:yes stop_codon:yes gene_type:complete